MREFLAKLNSNKALKLAFCVAVAIPIWLLGMWLFPQEEPEDVSANIVVIERAEGVDPGVPEENDKSENKNTEEREKLHYKSASRDDYVIVHTFQEDVDFNAEYIEKVLRPLIAQDMIDEGLYTNVSAEQLMGNWRLEELEITSKKIAYYEEGTVKGDQYAACYIKVGNNFVYGAVFGSPDESHEFIVNCAKGVNTYVSDYIQQARANNANKEE